MSEEASRQAGRPAGEQARARASGQRASGGTSGTFNMCVVYLNALQAALLSCTHQSSLICDADYGCGHDYGHVHGCGVRAAAAP